MQPLRNEKKKQRAGLVPGRKSSNRTLLRVEEKKDDAAPGANQ